MLFNEVDNSKQHDAWCILWRETTLEGFVGEVGADELGHGEGPELVLDED